MCLYESGSSSLPFWRILFIDFISLLAFAWTGQVLRYISRDVDWTASVEKSRINVRVALRKSFFELSYNVYVWVQISHLSLEQSNYLLAGEWPPALIALNTFVANFLSQLTAVASTESSLWTSELSSFWNIDDRLDSCIALIGIHTTFCWVLQRLCTLSFTIRLTWNKFGSISGGNWIWKMSIIFSIIGNKRIGSSHAWNRPSWHPRGLFQNWNQLFDTIVNVVFIQVSLFNVHVF